MVPPNRTAPAANCRSCFGSNELISSIRSSADLLHQLAAGEEGAMVPAAVLAVKNSAVLW
jgi:hypothetical protein